MEQPVVALLHGAGTDGRIWERVRMHLVAESVAPDLASRGRDARPATCAAQVVASLGVPASRPVVLVMHSLAGVLAHDLGRILGPRVKACVYVAAVVPAEGGSFAQAMGFPGRWLLPLLFRLNPNGLRPSERMIRAELCEDLSAEDASLVVERYQPEYPGLYLSAVGAPPTVPSTYVSLARDRSVPPTLQARVAARVPQATIRELDGGHLVMLSRPSELAATIDQVIATA